MDVPDQLIELVVRLIVVAGPDKPHVDGGMAAVGYYRQQNVIPFLDAARAAFDLRDAVGKTRLIIAEGFACLCGDQLALPAADAWQAEVLAEIVLQNDVGRGPEHVDQFRDVHKLREAFDGLVGAGRLQFKLGAGVAEGCGPGVELVHAALVERLVVLEPQEREHLAERIRDRCARCLDQRAARVLCVDEAGLDPEIPGTLRTFRIDPFQVEAVRCEGQFTELLRFVHDDLIDPDLFDRDHVVAVILDRFQLVGSAFQREMSLPISSIYQSSTPSSALS